MHQMIRMIPVLLIPSIWITCHPAGTKLLPHSRIAPKPDVHSPLPSKYTHTSKPVDRPNSHNHIHSNIQPRLVPKVNKIPDNYDDVFNAHLLQRIHNFS